MAYLPPYTVLAAQEGVCAEFQKTADLANIYLGYFSPVLGFATCGIEAKEQQLQAFPKK